MPPARTTTPSANKASEEKRVARRERRRERSREEILEAARRVLLRNGVGATTLDAVAREVGVTKTALYYYFPSKDALFFELMFGILEAYAKGVHDTVETAKDGGDALRILIRESIKTFAPRLEDFRLAFLHGQVASPGSVHFDSAQFARIRPLNDLWLAGAAKKLAADRNASSRRRTVEPRLMAFLAYLSAIGVLTMKGMVESVGDPLIYSDDQLIDGLAKIFEAAAASASRAPTRRKVRT